ncbi:plasmid mobilization relaxosome protein MobC [Paraflavisolibacter sp. H34]|uniref:plasmid mobilization protein n=1 Tax=Huijunlia imazamoxiresistens TaxID=3127457 RepID=UPI0030175C5E
MKEEKVTRNQWLHIRLSLEEFQKIQSYQSHTTCRGLSEYARKKLLGKPIIGTYRNQSEDEIMAELAGLHKEVTLLEKSFTSAVKRLQSLSDLPGVKAWLVLNEAGKEVLFKKVEEIKSCMHKIYDLWLQE